MRKLAVIRHGKPVIFNTDMDNQLTSTDVIRALASRTIKISMGCKRAWRDNVFVQHLWRTFK